ncbi:MAG: hypothetical protein ABL957_07050, partial [Parvularculaceae bacterium]
AAPAPPAPRSRASFFQRRKGVLRGATLILATTLSLFGAIGQFHFVDAVEDVAEARAEEMRAIETRTETLRTAQSAYFNAQVQANMLFALNPADRSVNKGIVANLYALAITDRGFPFRSILGELAIAGAIDFKTVNERYNSLREAATADFAYASFMAVGEFEHEILDQAMTLHAGLQDRFWKAQEEKAVAEREADKRRAALLTVSGFATCLFLLASLMGVKD